MSEVIAVRIRQFLARGNRLDALLTDGFALRKMQSLNKFSFSAVNCWQANGGIL